MTDLNLAASWDGETRSVTSEHPWVDRTEVRDICVSKAFSVQPGKTIIYTFRNSLSSPKLAGHISTSPTGEHFVSSDVIQLQEKPPDKKTQRNSIESIDISSTVLTGLPHHGSKSPEATRKPVNTMAEGEHIHTDKPQVRPVRLPPAPPPPRSTSLQAKSQAELQEPDFVPQLLRHAPLDGSQNGEVETKDGHDANANVEKGKQLMVAHRGEDQSESSIDSDVSSDDLSLTFPSPKSDMRFFTAKDGVVDFSKRLSNKLSEPLPGDEEGEETHKTRRGHNPLKRFFARKKGKYDPSTDMQFSQSVLPSHDSDKEDVKKKKKNSPKNDKKKSYDATKDKDPKKQEVQKSKLTKDSIVVIKSSGKCLTDVSFDMAPAEPDPSDYQSEKMGDSDVDVSERDEDDKHSNEDKDNDNEEMDTHHKHSQGDDDDDEDGIYANFPTVQRRKTAGVAMNEPAKLTTFFAPDIQASLGRDNSEDSEEEKDDKSSSSSDEEKKDDKGNNDDERDDGEEIYVNSMFIPKLSQPVGDDQGRDTAMSESNKSDQSSAKSGRTVCYVVNPDPDVHEMSVEDVTEINGYTTTHSTDVINSCQMESKQPESEKIALRGKVPAVVTETYSHVDKSEKKEHTTVINYVAASPRTKDIPSNSESLKRFGTMENLVPDDGDVTMTATNIEVKETTDICYGTNNVAANVSYVHPKADLNQIGKGVESSKQNVINKGVDKSAREGIRSSSIEHVERFLGPDVEATMKKSLMNLEQENPSGTIAAPVAKSLRQTPPKTSQVHGVYAQEQTKIIGGQITLENKGKTSEKKNASLQTSNSVHNVDVTAETIHVSHAEIQAIAATKSGAQVPEKPPPKGIYSIIKSKTNPTAVITPKSSSVNPMNDTGPTSPPLINDSHATPSIPKRPTSIATKPFAVKATTSTSSPTSVTVNLVQPPNTPTSQTIQSDHPIPGISSPNIKTSRPPPTKPKPPSWKMKTMLRKFESPESDAPALPKKPSAQLVTRGSEDNINKDLIAGVLKELDDYIGTDLNDLADEPKHVVRSSDTNLNESVVSLHYSERDSQVYERFIEKHPDPLEIVEHNLDLANAETIVNKSIGSGDVVIKCIDTDLKQTDPGYKSIGHTVSLRPRVDTAKYEEVVDWDLSSIPSAKALISQMSQDSSSEKRDEKSAPALNMTDRGYDDVVDKIDEKAEKIYDEIREANGSESPTSKCFKFNWKKRDAAAGSESSKIEKVKTKDENKERDKKKVKVRKDKTTKEETQKVKNGDNGKHKEKKARTKDKGKKHGINGRSLSNSSSHGQDVGSESSSQKSGSSSSSQPSSEDSEYEVVGNPEITKLRADTGMAKLKADTGIAILIADPTIIKDVSLKENMSTPDLAVENVREQVHGADSYGYEIPANYSIKRHDHENVKLSLKDDRKCYVDTSGDTNTVIELGTPDVDKTKHVLGEYAKDKEGLKSPTSPDDASVSVDKENKNVGDSKEKLISTKVGSFGALDGQLSESDWSAGNIAQDNPVSIKAEPGRLISTLESGCNVAHVKAPAIDIKDNSQKDNVAVGMESSNVTLSLPKVKDPTVKTATKSQSKSVAGVSVTQPRTNKPKEVQLKHHHSSSSGSSSTSEDSDGGKEKRGKKNDDKKRLKNNTIPTVNETDTIIDAFVKGTVTSPKIYGLEEMKPDKEGRVNKNKSTPEIEVEENGVISSKLSLDKRSDHPPSVAVKTHIGKPVKAKFNDDKTHIIKTSTQGSPPKNTHSIDMKVGQLTDVDSSQIVSHKYQSPSVQDKLGSIHLQASSIKTSETKETKEIGFPEGGKSRTVPARSLQMSIKDKGKPRSDAELSVLEIPDVHFMSELDEDPWKDYSALELGKNTRDLSPRQLPPLGDGKRKETPDAWLLDMPDKSSDVLPDTAEKSRSLPPDHAAPPVPRIRSSLQMTNESADLSDLTSVKASFKNKLKKDATPGGTGTSDLEIYSDGTSEPGTLASDKNTTGQIDTLIGKPQKHDTISNKAEHDNNDKNHLNIETETRERQYDELPVRMRKSVNNTSTFEPIAVPASLSFEASRLPAAGSKGKNPAEKSEYAEPWEEKKFDELSPLEPAFLNSRSSSEYSGNSANQARMSLTSEDLHPASVINFNVGTMNRSTSLDQVPGSKTNRRAKTPDDGKKGISLSSLSLFFHRKKKDKKGSTTDDGDNESDKLSDDGDSVDNGRPDKSKHKKEKHKKPKSTTEPNKKTEKRKSDKDKPAKIKKAPAKTEKGQRSSLLDPPDGMEMVAEGRPLCRLIRVNGDGSRDVELTRPQSEPLGIFFSKGHETKKDGLVVKSFLDKHAKKLFAGILRVGDEIIEIDETDICPLTLDEVKDIIQQKERMVIKLAPLEGGEKTLNLTSSGPL